MQMDYDCCSIQQRIYKELFKRKRKINSLLDWNPLSECPLSMKISLTGSLPSFWNIVRGLIMDDGGERGYCELQTAHIQFPAHYPTAYVSSLNFRPANPCTFHVLCVYTGVECNPKPTHAPYRPPVLLARDFSKVAKQSNPILYTHDR